MNQPPASTDHLIAAARQAIEANRPAEARPLLERAAHQDSGDPRPWLLLAGIAATPRERRVYLAQARRLDALAGRSRPPAMPAPQPRRASRRGLWLGGLALLLAGALLLAFHPVGRALLGRMAGGVSALTNGAPEPTADAAASVAVATATAIATQPTALPTAAAEVIPPTPTNPPVFPTKGVDPNSGAAAGQPLPTWTPTALPTPTLAPTLTPTPTPLPEPTTPPVAVDPGALSPRPAGVGETERWIDVNLSTQTLVAYEGDTPVFNTLVSSGLPQWPTVTGQFRTYMKYESQTMNGYLLGYDYFLPDVPYVMYFYEDYAIHGTYWHNNFGTPMSHGCVNVSTPDAGWLFNWAPVGTLVNVRY
ncbi:MAG TPA: L,D-transpeptidase family protein [Promineifilum sp.]|nr:L,D-transpeptidase family protein [Promineifilum sp.]